MRADKIQVKLVMKPKNRFLVFLIPFGHFPQTVTWLDSKYKNKQTRTFNR